MGVDSTFRFVSKDAVDVKKQLTRLQKKVKFDEMGSVLAEFTVGFDTDYLNRIDNFIEAFDNDVASGLAVGFNSNGQLSSTYSFPHYLNSLEMLEKDPDVNEYTFSLRQPSSKLYEKCVVFHYNKRKLPMHFSPWLEKNTCNSAIIVSFSNHDYGVEKGFDKLFPYFQEVFKKFNVPFEISEREEYGKLVRFIESYENAEVFFSEAKLDRSTVNLFFLLKKTTPVMHYDSVLSFSFFDPTEMNGRYSGNYRAILKKLLEMKEKNIIIWPQKINIYSSYNISFVQFPTEKLISFILANNVPADYLKISFPIQIPGKLIDSEAEDIYGEIEVANKNGEIKLSFHMRGYTDIVTMFQKEFDITVKDTDVG